MKEKNDMHAMFSLIEDSLISVANASNDVMMERADDPPLRPENELIAEWGRRWLRVFRRKAAVEEAFFADAMGAAVPVGTMAPPMPAAAPAEATAEPVSMTDNGERDGVDGGAAIGGENNDIADIE